MLGIEKGVVRSGKRIINAGVDAVKLAGGSGGVTKDLLEKGLLSCIGRLVKGMEGKNIDISEQEEGEIEGVFLRALVEIVKGCEEGGFSAAD